MFNAEKLDHLSGEKLSDAPDRLQPSRTISGMSRTALSTSTTGDLSRHLAGQAVVAKLLSEQAQVSERGALARAFGVSPLHEDTRPWYWGAIGEIAVGELLSQLGSAWRVVHAVPVGSKDSDIDHVVVGPPGVFTVNTKNHSGQSVWVARTTFLVAGQRKPWIRNSEHEAARAARLLTDAVGAPVVVRPLIVVTNPRSLTVKEPPREVTVLTARRLVRWLRMQPPVLSDDQVGDISLAAASTSTWVKRWGAAVSDGAADRRAYERLHREVLTAMRVRLAWRLGGVGLVVLGCLQALPG